MKKIIIILAYALIGGIFLYNIGAPRFIKRLNQSAQEEKRKYKDLSSKDQWRLDSLVEQKYQQAKKLAKNYSPDKYFQDLTEIYAFGAMMGDPRASSLKVTQLQNISVNNIHQGFYSYDSVEVAKAKFKTQLDKLRGIDPEVAQQKLRDKINKVGWPKFFWLIFLKILLFYGQNWLIPFLFILIWWLKEEEKMKIKSWKKLFWFVILHPYFLTKIIYQSLNENAHRLYFEATLRQTKDNLFAPLSKEEEAQIKEALRRGLSLSSWVQTLRQRGLTPKHALLGVLLVCIFIWLVPVKSQTTQNPKTTKEFSLVKLLGSQEHPPGQHFDQKSLTTYSGAGPAIINAEIKISLYAVPLTRTVTNQLIRPCDWFQKIEHIPLFG